jgi:hypothetical protein
MLPASSSGLASSFQPTAVTACLPRLREQSQGCVPVSPARTTRLAGGRVGSKAIAPLCPTPQPQALSVPNQT